MTIGIVCACKDGVVVGSDRKTTRFRGTQIKSLEKKITEYKFENGTGLLATGSGNVDLVRRGIEMINPAGLGQISIRTYREEIERRIALLRNEILNKGIEYEAVIIWATIEEEIPYIGHITPTALTELRSENYYTTGIAAPYAEFILRDAYEKEITVEEAKLVIGALIKKIGEVDNDVEGFDILWIKGDGSINELKDYERMTISESSLFLNIADSKRMLKEKAEQWKRLLPTYERSQPNK